jgi:hypothetical protein
VRVFCSFCAHLVNASHLRPKKLRKRDKDMAREQSISRLLMLAEEEGIRIDRDTAATIVADRAFLRSAAYSAYALSLLERIRGDEGGLYALALWREIAWKPEGSPIKGFQLQADDILDAERGLIEEMKDMRKTLRQVNEPLGTFLRRNKRRHRAIERVGDGAEHFSFHFCDDTVRRDGQRAGLEHVLLDLAYRLGQTSQAGIHVREFALIRRQKIELNLRGVI